MDTGTALRMAASHSPRRIAILDRDRAVPYGELAAEVDRLAAGLRSLGVRGGDRVVLAVANSADAALMLFAIQAAGAVAIPVNFRTRSDSLAWILARTGAIALIVDGNSAASARDLQAPPPGLLVAQIDGEVDTLPGTLGIRDIRPHKVGRMPRVDDEDPALILLTSGSTGAPKLVKLSHRQSLARVYGLFMNHGFRLDDGMRALGLMPVYHTVGMHAVMMLPLLTGGSYHPVRSFSPPAVVPQISLEAITYVFGTPTMFVRLISQFKEAAAYASVTDALYAGAPMSTDLVRRVAEVITPNLTHIYGNTETFNSLYHRSAASAPGALVPGVFHRVRIANPAGASVREVPTGQVGELLVDLSSPEAFSGYDDLGRSDAAAVTGRWYRTGDAAVRDGHAIFIRGRIDDMIITGGENVYPAEVEDVLSVHPGVTDCAVLGSPDPTWGQLVTALVVRSDSSVTEEALFSYCRNDRHMESHKCPRRILFVDEIPITATGKRAVPELRALASRLLEGAGN